MPRGRKRRSSIDEKQLTRGQIRKLNALRKSVGDNIANAAFTEWLSDQGRTADPGMDKNMVALLQAIEPMVLAKNIHIPRSGYIIRRGRGRVILEHPDG